MALLSSSSKAYNAWAASAISIWCVASVVQGFSVGPTAVVRHSYYGSKTTTSSSSTPIVAAIRHTKLLAKGDDFDDDDEDDEDSDLLADSDWRDFRAKLVMGENAPSSGSSSSSSSSTGSTKSKDKEDNAVVLGDDGDLDGIGSIFQDSGSSISSSARSNKKMGSRSSTDDSDTMSSLEGMTPLDPSQWAYDSGKIIEQGAVILGGVEQDFGFGLRQQYFHKAAILVLDHEESTFTKGIILNRPTDLTLEDDINPGVRWRVWFGGVSILMDFSLCWMFSFTFFARHYYYSILFLTFLFFNVRDYIANNNKNITKKTFNNHQTHFRMSKAWILPNPILCVSIRSRTQKQKKLVLRL